MPGTMRDGDHERRADTGPPLRGRATCVLRSRRAAGARRRRVPGPLCRRRADVVRYAGSGRAVVARCGSAAHAAPGLERRRALLDRLPATVAALLGHPPAARQHLAGPRGRRQAAPPGLRVGDRGRRPDVCAAGQLCARAHHAAAGRAHRCRQAALRDHRSARRPRPRHRRLQGRSEMGVALQAGPSRATSSSSSATRVPGQTIADVARGRSASSCANVRSRCIPPAASRASSATARAAGR